MDSNSPEPTCDARPSVNSASAFTAFGKPFSESKLGHERSGDGRSGAPPRHPSAGGHGHP